ncbi:LLM class flavin-dependent oxidoreductase [Nocardia harenae]|uniref:LLM class flavin-dependent oxidoreductase n=1 Tax=Nocardia harenae TaxID=358707 RepID=UPI000A45036D|nr:LLM class flavin-dependent oxidoreductase [Nocardia harenae]
MERIRLSEQWGYDAVFSAEGLGSDALTPLGFVAGQTTRLKLGTRILQIYGRAPEVAARALTTLDHLSGGGRVLAGLGGTRSDRPIREMREYVTALRAEFDRIGLDRISDIPLQIAASGPQMVELAAEIGDGWMPSFFTPGALAPMNGLLHAGFERAGKPADGAGFEIWAHVDVLVDPDVRAAMHPFKVYTATYAALQRPFMVARGYAELADRLAELTAADRFAEAVDAVPDEYIDEGWLVGPVERIRTRAKPWVESELTGLVVRYGAQLGARNAENLDAFHAVARAAGRG